MKPDTQGWFPPCDLKGQCAECSKISREKGMVSCDYGERRFPAAMKCLQFKKEDDEG